MSIKNRLKQFSIAICRPTSDKWKSKTLFLAIFDPRSSIVRAFSIAAYPVSSRILKQRSSFQYLTLQARGYRTKKLRD